MARADYLNRRYDRGQRLQSWAYDLRHGSRRRTEDAFVLLQVRARLGRMDRVGRQLLSTHDPCRVAAAVQWCLNWL
jgi:hypothetical protein